MARRPHTADDTSSVLSRLKQLISDTVPPIHPAGFPYIAGSLAVGLLGRNHSWIRNAGLISALGCAAFFRHPRRVPPLQDGIVVAPADGIVCLIDDAAPPPELAMGDSCLTRVSIFMSIFDAHVQRFPISGEVVDVQYQPGKFYSAELPQASTDNERNSVRIRTEKNQEIVVVQVAGLIARRILCFIKPGDKLNIGDTYGLIRFGSRLDIYFPSGTKPLVQIGQRMIAGETPIAKLL